ncbi:hypothetical protein SAMN04487970_10641 [Paenibacillus tianmuensis]|uniref:IseA DL-endopeptidase inhibitor n=1 Tax=Paenibacillus tianmuensis TaxID=624147 RepID=A0A1G4TRT4_9BACL|nr:hypothetical protein [Paenibacillus tianmuensis]SCW84054.1 hypothetical protein SAMN04487970_10641 [Paenibacillus tianmuensis]
MKKTYISVALLLCMSISMVGCDSSQPVTSPVKEEVKPIASSIESNSPLKEDILKTEDVNLVISLLDNYSPSVLDDSVLEAKGDTYKWIWFNTLQIWTDDLIRLTHAKGKLEGKAKDAIIARLNTYFVPEESEEIFNTYFRKDSQGNYESIPTERFGKGTSSIHADLKVLIEKKGTKVIVRVTGTEYDYFDPQNKQKNKVDVEFDLIKKEKHYYITNIEHH